MTSLPLLPAVPYHSGKSADLLRLRTITNLIAVGDAASRRCGKTPAARDELLQCTLVYRSGAGRFAHETGNKKPAEAGFKRRGLAG
jgi:hypothetical protein